MTAFAEYLLKVIICSGVLTAYYWLALRNKIFHQWNRFYLLAAVVLSLTLPLLQFQLWYHPAEQTATSYKVLQTITTNETWFEEELQPTAVASTYFTTERISMYLYLFVSLLVLAEFVKALIHILRLFKKYQHWKTEQLVFVDTDAKGTPFSFFNFIFWNRNIAFESTQGQQIFAHELVHVKEKHSWDKLLLNLLLTAFWINPFFWLIRKELSMIHEFIADRKAVQDQDSSALAAMILATAFPGHTLPFTNPFFYSPIKRRLLMLSKLKNPKVSYISRLLLLPLLTFLVTAFAVKINRSETSPSHVSALEQPITVVIDAGHGYKNGKPDGAKGLNNLHEDEIALAICNKIKALNKDANLKLVFTRPTEAYVDLKERLRIATEQNADLFISIHAAYAPPVTRDGKQTANPANGAEIYVSRDGTPNLAKSKELGLTILSEMKTVMAIHEPGLKQRQKGIYVIQSNPIPSVLIECGFLSNKNDAAFVSDEKNQEKIAASILKGIVNFANGKKIAIQETTTSPLPLNDTVPVNQNKIFTKTEVDAKFKGNWALFVKDYLNKYKETLENDPKSKNGGCLLEFIVHEDGSISQIRVLTNTESKLANISTELLKNSPRWEPAIQNGKAVNKLVKTTVHYFDEDAWARYEERNRETGGTDRGMAKLTDKYGMFILDGKEISKEEMRTFLNNNPQMNNWKFNLMDGGGGINRYGEKGKNGVMEVMTKELKPTVAVAAENMNILFAGVDNPMKIAVSDIPKNGLSIVLSQGKIRQSGDRFIISDLKPGELILKVTYYYNSDKPKTEEVKYKVVASAQEIKFN